MFTSMGFVSGDVEGDDAQGGEEGGVGCRCGDGGMLMLIDLTGLPSHGQLEVRMRMTGLTDC